MADDGWRRVAEYPRTYPHGRTEDDPIVCPTCAPAAWRPWNWERLPCPRSSGVRVVYAPRTPLSSDAVCSECDAGRGQAVGRPPTYD